MGDVRIFDYRCWSCLISDYSFSYIGGTLGNLAARVRAVGEKKSDIVVATTTSPKPVLPGLEFSEWKGKLIVGVGSFRPTMQEISDQLLREADAVYVDASSALHKSGDIIQAKDLRTDFEGAWYLEKIITENHRPSNANDKRLFLSLLGPLFLI